MESCLDELHLNWCIIYLDDIIVFSRTPEEHVHRLRAVFEKLKAAGLKLKPSKCDFFKKEIKYLGHVVSEEGVSTDLAYADFEAPFILHTDASGDGLGAVL